MQEYDDERSRECDAREHTTHAGPRTMSRGTRRVDCISYRRVRNTGRAKAFLHSWHDTHSRTRGPGYNTAYRANRMEQQSQRPRILFAVLLLAKGIRGLL